MSGDPGETNAEKNTRRNRRMYEFPDCPDQQRVGTRNITTIQTTYSVNTISKDMKGVRPARNREEGHELNRSTDSPKLGKIVGIDTERSIVLDGGELGVVGINKGPRPRRARVTSGGTVREGNDRLVRDFRKATRCVVPGKDGLGFRTLPRATEPLGGRGVRAQEGERGRAGEAASSMFKIRPIERTD